MPKLDREATGEGPIVQGFTGNGFRISGDVYPTGAFLTPEWVREWRAPEVIEAIDAEMLMPVLALDPTPEFLLLGTGATLRRPARLLIDALERRGVGIEIMDSRAAARAWGVLRAEERWIAAALMPLL
ncbi:Mth938-like domain-containing protein [Flavisphingomonas formosensis]|uniref:Mth938-like domain-containing protein n=1 Tax=Flavisphingomonas formosensis TaxID=861534 RepID=UPI0012F7D253|nr:MTH938/NDUFAF3 family protein [Sphingomonas formosensis]